MRRMSEKPIVSFSRDGETFELGTTGLSPILHMYGSTGLGIAPVEVSDSERLGGDGSIVRGVRFGKREVYIPLRMEAETTAELSLLRRRLARLITPVSGDPAASLVDVTIRDPATGVERMVRGIYKDGLDGDFGTGYHGYWQKLGITFECPDPWWLGPERTRTMQIYRGSKAFLSRGATERVNLAANPSFASLTGAFGAGTIVEASGASVALSSDWSSAGDTSVKITPGSNVLAAAWLSPYSAALIRGGDLAGKTITVALDMYLPEAQSGASGAFARSLGIGVMQADGSVGIAADAWSEPAPNEAGVHRLVKVYEVPEGARGIYLSARNGSTSGPVFVDALTVEEGLTGGSYFDGDSEGASWTGTPHESTSYIVTPGSGTPFFPIVLAPSSIVGEYDVPIQGDGEVWPAWEIQGPGRDLTIQRGDDRIFIAGEFPAGSVTRIQTRPRRITPDRWDDVSLGSKLFPLRPGPNRIRITMVDAVPDTPDSPGTLVRLVWQERYLEGI